MNEWLIKSSHNSTNPENLVKIGSALSDITTNKKRNKVALPKHAARSASVLRGLNDGIHKNGSKQAMQQTATPQEQN